MKSPARWPGLLDKDLNTLIVTPHRAKMQWSVRMSERPLLSAETLEMILECQHAVDKEFWPQLYELMEPAFLPLQDLAEFNFSRGLSETAPEPPKPSLPRKLAAILAAYSIKLFDCEYCRYPSYPPDSYRIDLRRRIEERVIDQIKQAEKRANGSLRHHGTKEQIRAMIREALENDPVIGTDLAEIPSPQITSPAPQLRSLKDRLKATSRMVGSVKELIARLGIPRSTYYAARNGRVSSDLVSDIEEKLTQIESRFEA